jgi:hypothetical protein
MANVAHKNLTGADLHEPKGADAATANHVYVADGAGSGTWQKVTSDSLDATSNPFGASLYHLQDQQTGATAGGTFTSAAWRTRTLNTEVTDEITGSSLSSNQFTLPAGTYFIIASAPAISVNRHQIRLRNITDGSTPLVGTNEYANSTITIGQRSHLSGRFTIAAEKVFELQHRCETTSNSLGFGIATNFDEISVYADVLIWKL